jgi:hypothetical protein
MSWTLEINGVAKTLAEWGIDNVRLRLANSSIDTLSFTRRLQQFDADPLCAPYEVAVLLNGADIWFRGERAVLPADASGTSESQTYRFDGPWRWLADNVLQQLWRGLFYTSHIIMVGNVGQRIRAVLDYAIDNGAPIAYQIADLNALTAFPPTNEFTGQMCASAVTNALQWAPDTIAWFDYSAAVPVLRFGQRPNLAAVNLPFAPASNPVVSAVSLDPRPDLQVPSVAIIYERIDTEDGEARLTIFRDVHPPAATGREDGALADVVMLQGRDTTNIKAKVECQTIDVNSLAWWKRHVKKLREPNVRPITAADAPIAGDAIGAHITVTWTDRDGNAFVPHPRELIEGQLSDWMVNPDGSDIEWEPVVARVEFKLEEFEPLDGSIELLASDRSSFTVELMSTNAPNGITDYETVGSIDFEEATPIGLAQALFNSLSVLHYEGAFQITEQECSGLVDMGNVVNLTGSRAEFAAMRALVQEITCDIDRGVTTVQCGPPGHLSISDYLSILRANQHRRRWTREATQDTGELSASGEVNLGKATANTDTMPTVGVPKTFVVKEAGAANSEIYIRLSVDDLNGLDPVTQRAFLKKNARIRLATVCVRNAQGITEERYAGVLMTETFPIT